jgi:transketolase
MYNKKDIIKKIVEVAQQRKEGHIPSSLSILDIMYVIYRDYVVPEKGRFVLSKGHASLGLYAIMDHFGILEEDMFNFCKFDSKLGGHPSCRINGVECSTGSLGHGMPFALGLAMSEKILGTSKKVIAIIGDGESNEGTIWESALIASHHSVHNLCCILDHNHSTDRALSIGSMLDKFSSFGWLCSEMDGHDIEDISDCIGCHCSVKRPHFILAHTIKGKGIKMMEGNPEWHHKSPSEDNIKAILESI